MRHSTVILQSREIKDGGDVKAAAAYDALSEKLQKDYDEKPPTQAYKPLKDEA